MRMTLAASGLAVALTACSQPAPAVEPPDPGVVHAHGLDVDTEDGSLYIATHTGLFRAVEGARRSESANAGMTSWGSPWRGPATS